MRTHLILPAVTAAPGPTVREQQHAAYASTLVSELWRRYEQTGDLDAPLADRIERVLWPHSTQEPSK